ncbi:MAG: choline/ethanolamine kinase family protein, partial [Oscillospiraceae bacterium]
MNRNLSVYGDTIKNVEIPDFMHMTNLTRSIFKQEYQSLEIMPGGLTNKNFQAVMDDGTQVAIRVAGPGTANYINRPAEKHNATAMAALGIAPEIYYYDSKTGSQICEFIDKPTMHNTDFQTRDDVLENAGRIMRRYHDSGVEFKSSFNPIVATNGY